MSTYPAPTGKIVFNTVDYPKEVDDNVKKTGTNIVTGSLTFNHVTTISSSGWITVPAPALTTDTTSYTITSSEMPILAETYWSGVLTCYVTDGNTYVGTLLTNINKTSNAIVATAVTKTINPSVNGGNSVTAPSGSTLSINSTGKTKVTYVAWTLTYAKYPT